MDMNRLGDQLVIDEGKRLIVYKDSRGYMTVGVGHKVLYKDQLQVGDAISEFKCDMFLQKDMTIAVGGCRNIWKDFDSLPEEVQEILCNMCFELGQYGLSQFHDLIKFTTLGEWKNASYAMRESKWHGEVPTRSDRLIARMENVSG